jgi:hypothetical protein
MNSEGNTLEKRKYTGKDGKFIKGNPGKPKGSIDEVTKFKKAIENFEKDNNKSFYEYLLEKSKRSPQILITVFKALVPQKTESELKIESIGRPYKDFSDEELFAKVNEIFNRPRASSSRGDTTRA